MKPRVAFSLGITLVFFLTQDAFSALKVGITTRDPMIVGSIAETIHFLFPSQELSVKAFSVDSGVAVQPVGKESAQTGAQNRLREAKRIIHSEEYPDYWISLEHFIENSADSESLQESLVLFLEKKGHTPRIEQTLPEHVDTSEFARVISQTPANYEHRKSGYLVSLAQTRRPESSVILESSNAVEGYVHENPKKRLEFIRMALIQAMIKQELTETPDFPKPGVLFRDVSSIFASPELFRAVIQILKSEYESKGIQVIAGLESRGFPFGAALAQEMKLPFMMIRKSGKLPRPTHTLRYTTEYSTDEIQISASALPRKSLGRVLIVDDLLATGGTLQAAEKLFQAAGASEVHLACLIELTGLHGKSKLTSPFYSLIQY